jgi:predicted RNA-binding Zn ribbon-like protein
VSISSENTVLERESGRIVAFVNTLDVEEKTDELESPAAFGRWLSQAGWDLGEAAVDEPELRRLRALREALRSLLGANNGGDCTDTDLAPLRQAVAGARFQASLGADGAVEICVKGGGADAVESSLLLALERVQALGGWERLKACPAEDCGWAFFDSTRNRSRTWCSMEVCGNRSKTRSYRARHRHR